MNRFETAAYGHIKNLSVPKSEEHFYSQVLSTLDKNFGKVFISSDWDNKNSVRILAFVWLAKPSKENPH